MDLTGKRLLVLGGVAMIMELVENARSRGAYVIVSDYYENSPAKNIADEAWLISTADIDTLAEKCIASNVDGVISGFDDFNVICSQRLSERIGKPFYATESQVTTTMDKAGFKKLCRDNNVPSTPEYSVASEVSADWLKNISYPVIIKPVDSSGNRGITICNSEEELINAHKKALKTSKKGNIILEKYISGDQVGVNYILQDGEIYPSVLHDRYMQEGDGIHVPLPVAYVYPSKYTDSYLDKENEKVVAMFRSIGMKNGTLFLQGCVEDGIVYFYEMGYRINGAKQYQILDALCGFNPMEMVVNYSLTGHMEDYRIRDFVQPKLPKTCCTLSIIARPSRIKKIIGVDEIKSWEETLGVTLWYHEGDEIAEDALGTQRQICIRVTVAAKDTEELAKIIDRVYSTLDVLDYNDNSILLPQFDTKRLFED